MDIVKLALIGCGGYGTGYAREIGANPATQLAVACDTNPQHAESAAGATGALIVTDWRAALDVAGLDGVVIAPPNYLHAPITYAAAERGLHILCEKPMATTLADCQRMVQACHQAGVTLMIGLPARFDRAFQAGLALIRSGTLGNPVLITNVCHYTLEPAQPGRVWHNDSELMGGGALVQMGIHLIDRTCWYADAVPARVYAQLRKAGGRWSDNVALCQIDFANGILGQVEVAGLTSASLNTMTVHLTKGQIEVQRRKVRWYDRQWHEETHPADYLATEVRQFGDAITRGAIPECTGDMALAAHCVYFAACRANDTQQAVDLT